MNVLIIAPEGLDWRKIAYGLGAAGMKTTRADAEDAVFMAKDYDFDLILLDLDPAGISTLRTLRQSGVKAPLIALGVSPGDGEIKCLQLGADDCITRPYRFDVLLERCRAVTRRFRGLATSVITCGPIEVDTIRKVVHVHGKPVHLTGKELLIAEALIARREAVVSKEAIYTAMYGLQDDVEIKIIDVLVCKIRKAFGPAGAHIETVWGRGYRMVETANPKKQRYNYQIVDGRRVYRPVAHP